MKVIDPSLIHAMRKMAKDEQSASAILKYAHRQLPAESRNKITLIELFKDAFGLALHEASPIAGWDVNGHGELQDEQLDDLMIPALEKHREHWDGKQSV